jgi:ribosomal protein S18 acetylase RimI-like enzyme
VSGIVRRATVADVAALVRLRALMLAAMGADVGGPDAPWRAVAADWFAERLADPDSVDFAAFVVTDPELGVVCSAAGDCLDHPPGPNNLVGRTGHLFNVSTDPRRRRRGHARACVVALLDWFDTRAGVASVQLNATGEGIDIYTSLGFVPPTFPALRRGTTEVVTGRPGPAAAPADR